MKIEYFFSFSVCVWQKRRLEREREKWMRGERGVCKKKVKMSCIVMCVCERECVGAWVLWLWLYPFGASGSVSRASDGSERGVTRGRSSTRPMCPRARRLHQTTLSLLSRATHSRSLTHTTVSKIICSSSDIRDCLNGTNKLDLCSIVPSG